MNDEKQESVSDEGKFDQETMDRITDKVLAFRPKKAGSPGEKANRQSGQSK